MKRGCDFYIIIFLRMLKEILPETTKNKSRYGKNDEKPGLQVIRR